jgi:hypothetical protein
VKPIAVPRLWLSALCGATALPGLAGRRIAVAFNLAWRLHMPRPHLPPNRDSRPSVNWSAAHSCA